MAFLANCGTSQEVTIHSDRSALVSICNDSASYYRSVVIKDYTSTKKLLQFTILEVDSLGNYLSPVFTKNYFKFRYAGDSLEYSDGYGDPFVPSAPKACCGHRLVLAFDKPIKSIKTKSKFVTLKKNKVIIVKDRKDYMKERTFVTIYLGI